MKKKFTISNLNCAHCANKIESAIQNINGVINVSINFMTQKYILEADDELFNDIFEQSKQIFKKFSAKTTIQE